MFTFYATFYTVSVHTTQKYAYLPLQPPIMTCTILMCEYDKILKLLTVLIPPVNSSLEHLIANHQNVTSLSPPYVFITRTIENTEI